VELDASAVLWLPQNGLSRGSDGAIYGVRYARYTGELSGCYGFSFGRLEAAPCVLVRLEDVIARGTRGPEFVPASSQTPWVTVGLGARARWSIASFLGLFARPSVAFATARPTFVIDGVSPLYRVPAAGVAFELGCEWIF